MISFTQHKVLIWIKLRYAEWLRFTIYPICHRGSDVWPTCASTFGWGFAFFAQKLHGWMCMEEQEGRRWQQLAFIGSAWLTRATSPHDSDGVSHQCFLLLALCHDLSSLPFIDVEEIWATSHTNTKVLLGVLSSPPMWWTEDNFDQSVSQGLGMGVPIRALIEAMKLEVRVIQNYFCMETIKLNVILKPIDQWMPTKLPIKSQK